MKPNRDRDDFTGVVACLLMNISKTHRAAFTVYKGRKEVYSSAIKGELGDVASLDKLDKEDLKTLFLASESAMNTIMDILQHLGRETTGVATGLLDVLNAFVEKEEGQ